MKKKKMLKDVAVTLGYIDDVLSGALYKRELFRQALNEMGWISGNGDMHILEGRRYRYKGYKNSVAIEGNFSAYEYILEGLFRLQLGYTKGLIDTGILVRARIFGEVINIETGLSFNGLFIINPNHHTTRVHRINRTATNCLHRSARVNRNRTFHAGSD